MAARASLQRSRDNNVTSESYELEWEEFISLLKKSTLYHCQLFVVAVMRGRLSFHVDLNLTQGTEERNGKKRETSKKRKRSEEVPQNGSSQLSTHRTYYLDDTEKGNIFLRGMLRALEISCDFATLISLLLSLLKDREGISPLILRYVRSYEGMFFCQQQIVDLLDSLHNKVGCDRLVSCYFP
jgi:hypothetical protein